MEDSTWEGWTTPPSPRRIRAGLPRGSQAPRWTAGWMGGSVPHDAEGDRRRRSSSPSARGRRCRPRTSSATVAGTSSAATGVQYDLCHGNPMLGDDPELADVFFAEDGALWFLRRADRSEVRSKVMGTMGAMQVRS